MGFISRNFHINGSIPGCPVTVYTTAKSSSDVNDNMLRDAHKTQLQRFGAIITDISRGLNNLQILN
jgi:hypothetical protein